MNEDKGEMSDPVRSLARTVDSFIKEQRRFNGEQRLLNREQRAINRGFKTDLDELKAINRGIAKALAYSEKRFQAFYHLIAGLQRRYQP